MSANVMDMMDEDGSFYDTEYPDPLRDPIRANIVFAPCSGHGGTLYVIADSGNDLVDVRIKNGRIRLREGSYPYTGFFRNCNLVSTPRCCRGMLCIFRTADNPKYSLGIVQNLAPLASGVMHIFKWTGESVVEDGVHTPHFMYFARKFPLDFSTISADFTSIQLKVDHANPPDVIFVNTVCSHPSVPLMHDCVNREDKCFEMSPKGPDIIVSFDSIPNIENVNPALKKGARRFNYKNPNRKLNDKLPPKSPCCLKEPKKCMDHVPHRFHVVESEKVPVLGKEVVGLLHGFVAVPYATPLRFWQNLQMHNLVNGKYEISFGFITRKNWRKMVSMGKQTIDMHNSMLREKSVRNLALRVVHLRDTDGKGFRVSIATPAEMDQFRNKKGWREDTGRKDFYTNDSLDEPYWQGPGNVVISYFMQPRVSALLYIN